MVLVISVVVTRRPVKSDIQLEDCTNNADFGSAFVDQAGTMRYLHKIKARRKDGSLVSIGSPMTKVVKAHTILQKLLASLLYGPKLV